MLTENYQKIDDINNIILTILLLQFYKLSKKWCYKSSKKFN